MREDSWERQHGPRAAEAQLDLGRAADWTLVLCGAEHLSGGGCSRTPRSASERCASGNPKPIDSRVDVQTPVSSYIAPPSAAQISHSVRCWTSRFRSAANSEARLPRSRADCALRVLRPIYHPGLDQPRRSTASTPHSAAAIRIERRWRAVEAADGATSRSCCPYRPPRERRSRAAAGPAARSPHRPRAIRS